MALGKATLAGILAAALLAGCVPPAVDPPAAEAPPPRPEPRPEPVAEPAPVATPSAYSQALATYYRRLQNDLLAQGLMRGDGGGDIPLTPATLARNFTRIALYDEYVDDGAAIVAEPRLAPLRRWQAPVRFSVETGATVDADQAARDRATVASYVGRLGRITGHPMSVTAPGSAAANFNVFFLDEDERLAFGPRLRELAPGIGENTVRAITNLPRSTLCVVVALSTPGATTYNRAIAIIRAEHPEMLRTACVHEELAQGLGLANDHPQARPSIFNDDEEFALLTRQDELLLKILYDPRLSPGMSAAEAAPIVRQIADELLPPAAAMAVAASG